MNSHQRRKWNRLQSRINLRIVRAGGVVPVYGLSALEHRELRRIAVATYRDEDGSAYTLKTPEHSK